MATTLVAAADTLAAAEVHSAKACRAAASTESRPAATRPSPHCLEECYRKQLQKAIELLDKANCQAKLEAEAARRTEAALQHEKALRAVVVRELSELRSKNGHLERCLVREQVRVITRCS